MGVCVTYLRSGSAMFSKRYSGSCFTANPRTGCNSSPFFMKVLETILLISSVFWGCTNKTDKIDKLGYDDSLQHINAANRASVSIKQREEKQATRLNVNISTGTLKLLDSLLLSIYDGVSNSKYISRTKQAKQIISFGRSVLPALSMYFSDTTQTKIRSECQNFNLNRGEVAIVLADRIERMPYFYVTHIQNCTLQFCEDNPNLVEFYFYAIRRDTVQSFQERYVEWLSSDDRKKSTAYIEHSE